MKTLALVNLPAIETYFKLKYYYTHITEIFDVCLSVNNTSFTSLCLNYIYLSEVY